MDRRRFITVLGVAAAPMSISGCTGMLPTGADDEPQYPGGTVIVENAAASSLEVTVSAQRDDAPHLETDVPAGETITEREFITAPAGAVVTLAAVVGGDGEPTTFEFLPGGGEETPSEVAHLSIENAVEESAVWTARPGTE